MHSWIPSYSADVTDQASVSTIDDDYGLTRERVMNYRPAIPQSLEEASDNLLDKLEQAGRVPSKEKFRRMACNTFIFTGACPYNDRCVFLHDYRIKAEGVKVRTTRQSKSNSAIKDTFYWPDMSRREVVRHLDQQGLPTANQMYVIPDAFRSNPSNFHNRGLYSLWAHFVEFCVHNSVFYTKKYRDVTSEPFFQVSAYRENPHVPGAKRLDVFVKLSLGKSLCPASIALSPALSSFNRDSAANYRFSSKEPVMNALMEKQKRKTWSEANFKEHFPVYETPKSLNGNASGTAPYPSPVGFDNASFSPSGKPLLMKNRSKSAGSSAEAMFHPSWRSDFKPDFENEFDLECPTEDLYDAVDYNTAQQVELSLKSIDFDDDQGNTGNGDISALNTSNYDAPTFGWGLSTGSVDSPPYQSEFGPLNGATRMSANTAGFSTPASNWWDNTKLEEENNHSFQSRADTLWSPKFQPNQSLRYGNFGEHSKVSTIENFLAPKTDSPLMEKAPTVTKPQPSYAENQHYVIEPPASVAPRVSAPPVESNNFHYLVKGPGEKWDDYGANEWNSPKYEDSCATKYSNPYSSVTQRKKPKNPDYLSVKDHEFKDEGDWFSQLTCSHE